MNNAWMFSSVGSYPSVTSRHRGARYYRHFLVHRRFFITIEPRQCFVLTLATAHRLET